MVNNQLVILLGHHGIAHRVDVEWEDQGDNSSIGYDHLIAVCADGEETDVTGWSVKRMLGWLGY